MHDPMTVAFEIKSPFRREPDRFFPKGYRNTLVTIWHVDPEKDGTDDSCGWFKRARHGNKQTREKIRKAFASEWTGEHLGWFHDSGYPKQSVQATVLAMFQRAAYIYFGGDWTKAHRFMQRNLFALIWFSENNTDSLYDGITQKYGADEKQEDRIEHFADVIYAWILRAEQKWYQHPRWHVWHWKFQVHALQSFKRWAFSRCSRCGGRFAWGYAPTTNSWNGGGPRWFRSERDVFHSDCTNPKSHNAAASMEVSK